MKKKIIGITAIVMVLAAVMVYGVGYWRCSKYFSSQTIVASTDIGGQTYAAAKANLENQLSSYRLEIQTRTGTEVITAEDIHMAYEGVDDTLNQILASQENIIWFWNSDTEEQRELPVAYDEQVLSDRIDSLACMNNTDETKPKSAYITGKDGNFQVVPEEEGNILKKEQAKQHIMEAVAQMQTEVSLEEDYKEPKYTAESKEITDEMAQIEKMLSTKLTITDGTNTEIIDREVVKDFLVLEDDFQVGLDSEKIRVYVNQHFDPTFDTVGQERTFTNALRQEISVSGGSYGMLVDTLGEVDQLTTEITEGSQLEREPVYKVKETATGNGGIGNTFIEVSLSAQTLWLVKDGEIALTSPVVTGNVSKGRQTPTGIYYVVFKATDYTMKTYNSFVHYWMPYDLNEGIGFHDAMWRSRFGSNIYVSSGSHGCVNMPLANAKLLFENISSGIPVVIHN